MANPHSQFPGIPLIEAPVEQIVRDASDMSDADREVALRLHRDGFTVIDFPDPDIELRIERIKQRLSPQFAIDFDDRHSNKTGDHRIQDAWHIDEDVRAIATNPQVIDLLSRLYGRRAFPFQTLNFPVGTQQAAHSDSVHFSSIPERFMCGVWLAMEDTDTENGPLFYVPGSQRWPIMTNIMVGRRGTGEALPSAQTPYEQAWAALIGASGIAPQQFHAKKGQALIWCANLLHGGSPQSDPTRTRWSQVTHYFFEDCIYYTPAYSDEALGKLALRTIIDINDGTIRPNQFLGDTLAEPAPPPPVPRSVRRYRWLKRRLFGT